MKIISLPNMLVALLLLVAFGIRFYHLNYNSPFLDEAIYIRLGQEFFSGTLEAQAPYSWVGGLPIFYPSISAIAYWVGGILGARFVNVVLGTFAVYLVYLYTAQFKFFVKENQNWLAGIFAGVFFTVVPIALSLSRIAIYDMLSFVLFVSGIVFLQKALQHEEKNNYYIGAITCFSLSFLAKYTVIIFFPFISLYSFLYIFKKNKKRLEEISFFIAINAVIIGYYLLRHYDDLVQFLSEQVVNRRAMSPSEIFSMFWEATSIFYILAAIGLILLVRNKKYFAVALFLTSFIPLIVHIITSNTATFQQDMLFTFLFLIPFVGAIFSAASKIHPLINGALAVVIAGTIFTTTASTRSEFEHIWPNSTDTMQFLHDRVSLSDKVLVEADDVAYIALQDKILPDNIVGPYDFDYQNKKNADAYKAAIQDGYFRFIQVDETAGDFKELVVSHAQNNYKTIYSEGRFIIFQRVE